MAQRRRLMPHSDLQQRLIGSPRSALLSAVLCCAVLRSVIDIDIDRVTSIMPRIEVPKRPKAAPQTALETLKQNGCN